MEPPWIVPTEAIVRMMDASMEPAMEPRLAGDPEPRPASPRRPGVLARLVAWLEDREWRHRQRAVEAYLGAAVDHADLERRIHAMVRGGGFMHP